MKMVILGILMSTIVLCACNKQSTEINEVVTPPPVPDPLPADTVVKSGLFVYEGLAFSAHNSFDRGQYFSSFDTTFKTPKPFGLIDSSRYQNIDLVYIHDYNYPMPGFMDPFTASQRWYWDNDVYYFPWLAKSKKTEFFGTTLTITEFNAIKINQTLLTSAFRDTVRAEHGVFPPGSCIGGRIYNALKKGQVWALKFEGSKRGLLYIRPDQDQGWPDFPVIGFRTKVDLIREK